MPLTQSYMYTTEECALELASMVRSNPRGDMGFVNDVNRHNVLISRAKHGMIIFGDLQFLTTAARSESAACLIVCEPHPAVHSDVSSPSQFGDLAHNGGCTQLRLLSLTAAYRSLLLAPPELYIL
eukprot:4591-Heterococcus_DN1.PRE.3